MKSITLAAVVALLVGGTALGADTSTIAYELELGGNNHLANWEQGFPPSLPAAAFSPGSPDDYPAATANYTAGDVITWDARVMASGEKDDTDPNYMINGATNLEFALEIRKLDCAGQLEAEATFLSTMNDGDADPGGGGPDDPLEMAAFCHIFNVPCPTPGFGLTCPGDGHGPAGDGTGPGRAYDVYAGGGPQMDRAQFPSTSTHAGGRITGADPAGHKLAGGTGVVANPGELAGKLVGMGVGYSQFSYPGGNTAGVGIDPALGVGGQPGYGGVCYRGLGQHAIFEGQINTTGMAGTYCLNLVAGANNNVMPGIVNCEAAPGHFAEPAATILGDEIIFYVIPVVIPCTADGWYSVRDHTGNPGLAITLDASASGKDVVSETRRYGVQRIEVDISATASVSLTATIQAENLTDTGFIPATSQGVIVNGGGSYTVWAEWDPGLANKKCYEIDLAGKLDCDLTGDTDCMVRGLAGDTNGDQNSDLIDMAQTKSKNGLPLLPDNIRFDVNLDGNVDLIDMALVKSLNGDSSSCP